MEAVSVEVLRSTPQYDDLLVWLVHMTDARVIVECGTYQGQTTAMLARATRGHVWTIDDWRDYPTGFAQAYILGAGVRDRVTFVEAETTTCPWDGPSIDLLFLDAAHTKDGICQEWHTWTPRLAPKGVVAIHDTVTSSVKEWVAEAFPREGWQTVQLPWEQGLLLGVRP